MKAVSKVSIAFIGILLIVWGVSVLTGYKIIIEPRPVAMNENTVNKTDTIRLFESFDFTEGNWSLYITIEPHDFADLPNEIPRTMCIKTNDAELLKSIGKSWAFLDTGGDVATVAGNIYLLHNGKLVFESGVALDKNSMGLQSPGFGWIEAVDREIMIRHIKQFKNSYSPIIIIQ